jgi:hypothetical protein
MRKITNCVRCKVLLKKPEENIVCSTCLWLPQSVSLEFQENEK